MSLDRYSPADLDLVARFSYKSYTYISGTITILQPAKVSRIQRPVTTPSTSFFESLPLELLHSICASLDFQSLSRLLRTSLRGKAIVESFPAYRDFMRYAPGVLNALGLSKLISVFSSALLHATLCSERCISCGEYGPYLFLPTCERACLVCLSRNHSLWIIPDTIAKKCFKITHQQLSTIPFMHKASKYVSPYRRQRFYSVKSVKQLAIKVHGSETAVRGLAPAPPLPDSSDRVMKEYDLFRCLLNAQLRPFVSSPLYFLVHPGMPQDERSGMGTIKFPSLSSQKRLNVELQCRGCELLWLQCRFHHTSTAVWDSSDLDPEYVFGTMKLRVRTLPEFLKHIQNCVGIKLLMIQEKAPSTSR